MELDRAYVLAGTVHAGIGDAAPPGPLAVEVFAIAGRGCDDVIAAILRPALARNAEGKLAIDGADLEPLSGGRGDLKGFDVARVVSVDGDAHRSFFYTSLLLS